MKCNDIQLFLIDYLDNTLDEATRQQVNQHLANCPACSHEVKELQMMQDEIDATVMEEPSPSLRASFKEMLHAEANSLITQEAEIPKIPAGKKVISFTVSHLLWRAAAVIILFGGGVLVGNRLTSHSNNQPDPTIAKLKNEVQDLKQNLMINMLDDESPSQRIEAVNYADNFATYSQPVVNALLNALNNDKNVNVRLAALYSLDKFSANQPVLDSLVASLSRQTDPIIQIGLINMLAAKKATKAKKPIQDILTSNKTIKEVKTIAEKGLKEL